MGKSRSSGSRSLKPAKSSSPFRAKTKRTSKRKTKKLADDTKKAGADRYAGHDSKGNKKALIDVISFREKGNRKKSSLRGLSIPEKTALDNSISAGAPVTGKGNITADMLAGTAICHKISDKAIRDKINSLMDSPFILKAYLEEGIKYITPDHGKHNTPAKGPYNDEVNRKLKAATKALKNFDESTFNEAEFAHKVGQSIANSPVNLFIGDSRQNSSNQANFDPNVNFARLTEMDDVFTPRSGEADNFSKKRHPDLRNGSSSSFPIGLLKPEELSRAIERLG
jgi:hypothetical protein